MRRAIILVLDGVGAGEAPDAPAFGDLDHPSTLAHVVASAGPIEAPLLSSLGFLYAGGIGDRPSGTGDAAFGRLCPKSLGGKDSVTGHWEMMGIQVDAPFPTYPNGFPPALISEFERRAGVATLGNKAASGTQIIDELGPDHIATGQPIVYTSADSVFQIACHEDVVSIARLYELCGIARELCVGDFGVQRVIARPFEGSPGAFRRTERRKDFPLPPPTCMVDEVAEFTSWPAFGIGVVPELFGGRGFLQVRRTQNNAEHWEILDEAITSEAPFIFANFEDFDMKFGHRNDPDGFARCLEAFDRELAIRLDALDDRTLLILTADHGNDPTTASTDHSREFVPFVCYRKGSGVRVALGDLPGFAHVGETVRRHLGLNGGFEPFAGA